LLLNSLMYLSKKFKLRHYRRWRGLDAQFMPVLETDA
jgi:hypothetical protein